MLPFTLQQLRILKAVATEKENKLSIGYVTFQKDFESYMKEEDGYNLHFGTRFHLHFEEEKIVFISDYFKDTSFVG